VQKWNGPGSLWITRCPWWLPEQECCAVVAIARAVTRPSKADEQVMHARGVMEGIAEGVKTLAEQAASQKGE